jgi:acyl carrier protein
MKKTKQEIVDKVNDFLINRLEIDREMVHPDAELRMDMGLTSIDAIHIALFLKQTFGVQPVEEDLTSLVTLDDLYNYIEKHQTL